MLECTPKTSDIGKYGFQILRSGDILIKNPQKNREILTTIHYKKERNLKPFTGIIY